MPLFDAFADMALPAATLMPTPVMPSPSADVVADATVPLVPNVCQHDVADAASGTALYAARGALLPPWRQGGLSPERCCVPSSAIC